MDFNLSEHDKKLQTEFAHFAIQHVAPFASLIDEKECFPFKTMAQLRRHHLMLLSAPQCYGGRGECLFSSILFIEELAKHCAATSIIFSTHSLLVCLPILRYGTEKQKSQLLSAFANKSLGAFALTEPQAGTEVLAIEMTAEKTGENYHLNGQKKFITNAGVADTYIVFAQTTTSPRKKLTAFLVPSTTKGFSVSKKVSKMGIRGSVTASITLEDCLVPATQILGELDNGYAIAMETLNCGRIGVAAQALGIAEGALAITRDYVQERRQFGHPLAHLQNTQFKLAELKTEIEAARLLVYQAALTQSTAPLFAQQASMAKLFASKTAMTVTTECLQLFGGNGYTKDYPIERMMRDAKITEIYEGTSEVQKMIISHQLLREQL